jgi:hypothetical protein
MSGYEVLTVVRIHKMVWVRTTYNWYMIKTIVEEQSGSIFTVCQKMAALCPDKTLPPSRLKGGKVQSTFHLAITSSREPTVK